MGTLSMDIGFSDTAQNVIGSPNVGLHESAIKRRPRSRLGEHISQCLFEFAKLRIDQYGFCTFSAEEVRVERVDGTIPTFDALEDLACDRQTGITHGADHHKGTVVSEFLGQSKLDWTCKKKVEDSIPRVMRIGGIYRLRFLLGQRACAI